jgi:uncharacterized membrane protein
LIRLQVKGILTKNQIQEYWKETSMDEAPYVVVFAVFEDDEAGAEAYKDLQQAEKDKKIDLENTVLISKDENGKIRIKEEAEKIAGEIGLGALVGGALGLLAGPAGVVALGAIGAALGGVSAQLDDVGFDDTRLKKLGERLALDNAAIIAVLEGKYSGNLVEELENRAARVVVEDLPNNFKEILEEGGSFAYRIAEGETDEAAQELGLVDPDAQEPELDPEEDQSE